MCLVNKRVDAVRREQRDGHVRDVSECELVVSGKSPVGGRIYSTFWLTYSCVLFSSSLRTCLSDHVVCSMRSIKNVFESHTFNAQHIGELRSGRRAHNADINRFRDLAHGVSISETITHIT